MKKQFLSILFLLLVSGYAIAAPNYQVYTPAPYTQNQVVQQTNSDIIEIVIDYSGSMRRWIDVAKNTMQNILPQIPKDTQVGLRVFGQKLEQNKDVNSNNFFVNVNHVLGSAVGTIAGNSCSATEQVVPISQLNPTSLTFGMNKAQIGSATPLTLALERTVYQDFASKAINQKKKIILITDGAESCGKNPCAFVRNLVRTRNDIQIDVIMINGGNNLKCLAEATNGRFYDVNSAVNFNSALSTSLKSLPSEISSNNRNNYSHYVQPQTSEQATHYKFLNE